MNNPAEVLVAPFKHIWLSMASQTNAWTTTNDSFRFIADLPRKIQALALFKPDRSASISQPISELKKEAEAIAARLSIQDRSPVVYMSFVGAWSLIEAAFEDMIVTILLNDSNAIARVQSAGIKIPPLSKGTLNDSTARVLYRRLEGKFGDARSVVATQTKILKVFGAALDYPAGGARVIDEINLVRNCILHRQGIIDSKVADASQRLAAYLGKKIPITDPLFAMIHQWLPDYTLAWLIALIKSPYLSDALKPEFRNLPIQPI